MKFIYDIFSLLFIQHPFIGFLLTIIIIFRLFFKQIKGFMGEFWVKLRLKTLPKDKYVVLNDIMIYSSSTTHQIDHLVISDYGIFVIETKMYSGFITGNEYDQKWTRHYGKTKFYFNNPIHQNYGHVLALKDILNLDESKFIPIVCFPGREVTVKVKTKHHITTYYTLTSIIQSYTMPIIDNKEEIINKIMSHNIKDKRLRKYHVKNIKENIIKDDTNKCPKCGGDLIERTGKYGKFIGCSNYPKCKYTTK